MTGELLRTGRKVGRTIYVQHGLAPADDDPLIGVMDTPELAARVVEAVNAAAPVAREDTASPDEDERVLHVGDKVHVRWLDESGYHRGRGLMTPADGEAFKVRVELVGPDRHGAMPSLAFDGLVLGEQIERALRTAGVGDDTHDVQAVALDVAAHLRRVKLAAPAQPAVAPDTPAAVRQFREAIEHARWMPLVASHIQDRLDVVQAEVDRLRPKVAPDTQSAASTRDELDSRVRAALTLAASKVPDGHPLPRGRYITEATPRIVALINELLRGGGADGGGEDEGKRVDLIDRDGDRWRQPEPGVDEWGCDSHGYVGDWQETRASIERRYGPVREVGPELPESMTRPMDFADDDEELDEPEPRCGAYHPEYGFTCRDLPKHHGHWHWDRAGGYWDIDGQHIDGVAEIDVSRLARAAGVSPDSDVEVIEAAIRAGREPEVVSGDVAALLPVGSIFIACDSLGLPLSGFVAITKGRYEFTPPVELAALTDYCVLYRAPAPAPAPLTVGDELRDVDDLRRAGVGAFVMTADDCPVLLIDDEDTEQVTHVCWRHGRHTSLREVPSIAWPMRLCGLPDGSDSDA